MRAPGTMSTSGSSSPVSPTVAPYPPSTDYTCDDLRPARLTPWLRPELCSFPALQVAPRRSAPSCWRARRLPACAVCEPAFGAGGYCSTAGPDWRFVTNSKWSRIVDQSDWTIRERIFRSRTQLGDRSARPPERDQSPVWPVAFCSEPTALI